MCLTHIIIVFMVVNHEYKLSSEGCVRSHRKYIVGRYYGYYIVPTNYKTTIKNTINNDNIILIYLINNRNMRRVY